MPAEAQPQEGEPQAVRVGTPNCHRTLQKCQVQPVPITRKRFAFRPEQRLLRKRDFDAVFRQPAIRVGRGPLRLVAKPNEVGTARLGVVVGKRMVRRAVRRNRVKRRIRESFRLAANLPPMDMVVRVVDKDPWVTRRLADRLFAALAKRAAARDDTSVA